MTAADRADRIEAALAGLDFRQRVGQLNQRLLGWRAVERTRYGFRMSDEGRRELDRWSGLGALYGAFRADAWSGRDWRDGIRPEERGEVAALVQDEARARSGLGVLLSEEAPHGHQALGGSTMPVALAAAASFDPYLVEEASAAVAAELASSGAHLALVSTLDLLRDPRWGRAEECFGEDPHLASAMTAAVVRGMQGPDRSRVGTGDGVAVVLKHLAAQGESMGGRNGQSSVIGPRDLAELHLPMVAAGARAGALGFMAAYNDIDGVPCCANEQLLRGLLRRRLGFDGIVMADGFAVDRLQSLGGGTREAGRTALLAGVDLSLWDEGFTRLDELADDPDVRSAVDEACRRVLELKDRFGLLGRRAERRPDPVARIAVGEQMSERLADASLVLLDDGGVLPWTADRMRSVVVAGPFADDATALLGDYVPPPASPLPTVATALQSRLPEAVVQLATDDEDAVRRARTADAVVVVVGGTSHRSYDEVFAVNGAAGESTRATCGEGVDLADLDLPSEQVALVRRLCAAAPGRVAAVVVAGRPHVLTPIVDTGCAILWAGYPGSHGGPAIARALLGDRSPTGRLPFTAPRSTGVVPVHHNDRHAATYADEPDPVLFPFGAGRGYADAEARSLDIRIDGEAATLTIDVHGHADLPTQTPLPVFVRRAGGAVAPRLQELIAMPVARLAAGESRTLHLSVPLSVLRAEGAARPRCSLRLGELCAEFDLPPAPQPG